MGTLLAGGKSFPNGTLYGKLFNAAMQAPLTSILHPQGMRLDTDARLCGSE
jgi:hypothetical protein